MELYSSYEHTFCTAVDLLLYKRCARKKSPEKASSERRPWEKVPAVPLLHDVSLLFIPGIKYAALSGCWIVNFVDECLLVLLRA